MIAEDKLEGCAAIASDLAAKAWGMSVLARNIEDDDVNYTRFLLLARQVLGEEVSYVVILCTSCEEEVDMR